MSEKLVTIGGRSGLEEEEDHDEVELPTMVTMSITGSTAEEPAKARVNEDDNNKGKKDDENDVPMEDEEEMEEEGADDDNVNKKMKKMEDEEYDEKKQTIVADGGAKENSYNLRSGNRSSIEMTLSDASELLPEETNKIENPFNTYNLRSGKRIDKSLSAASQIRMKIKKEESAPEVTTEEDEENEEREFEVAMEVAAKEEEKEVPKRELIKLSKVRIPLTPYRQPVQQAAKKSSKKEEEKEKDDSGEEDEEAAATTTPKAPPAKKARPSSSHSRTRARTVAAERNITAKPKSQLQQQDHQPITKKASESPASTTTTKTAATIAGAGTPIGGVGDAASSADKDKESRAHFQSPPTGMPPLPTWPPPPSHFYGGYGYFPPPPQSYSGWPPVPGAPSSSSSTSALPPPAYAYHHNANYYWGTPPILGQQQRADEDVLVVEDAGSGNKNSSADKKSNNAKRGSAEVVKKLDNQQQLKKVKEEEKRRTSSTDATVAAAEGEEQTVVVTRADGTTMMDLTSSSQPAAGTGSSNNANSPAASSSAKNSNSRKKQTKKNEEKQEGGEPKETAIHRQLRWPQQPQQHCYAPAYPAPPFGGYFPPAAYPQYPPSGFYPPPTQAQQFYHHPQMAPYPPAYYHHPYGPYSGHGHHQQGRVGSSSMTNNTGSAAAVGRGFSSSLSSQSSSVQMISSDTEAEVEKEEEADDEELQQKMPSKRSSPRVAAQQAKKIETKNKKNNNNSGGGADEKKSPTPPTSSSKVMNADDEQMMEEAEEENAEEEKKGKKKVVVKVEKEEDKEQNNKNVVKKTTKKERKLPANLPKDAVCLACGEDNLRGLLYGLVICESCKAFFRRAVKDDLYAKYTCSQGHGKCVINNETRTKCLYCRYQCCLRVGLRPETVLKNVALDKERKQQKLQQQQQQQQSPVAAVNVHPKMLQMEEMLEPTKAEQKPTIVDADEGVRHSIELLNAVVTAFKAQQLNIQKAVPMDALKEKLTAFLGDVWSAHHSNLYIGADALRELVERGMHAFLVIRHVYLGGLEQVQKVAKSEGGECSSSSLNKLNAGAGQQSVFLALLGGDDNAGQQGGGGEEEEDNAELLVRKKKADAFRKGLTTADVFGVEEHACVSALAIFAPKEDAANAKKNASANDAGKVVVKRRPMELLHDQLEQCLQTQMSLRSSTGRFNNRADAFRKGLTTANVFGVEEHACVSALAIFAPKEDAAKKNASANDAGKVVVKRRPMELLHDQLEQCLQTQMSLRSPTRFNNKAFQTIRRNLKVLCATAEQQQ